MSKTHNRLQKKSRRRLLSRAEADGTLLTVDVNLRTEKVPPSLTSPAGTTLWELRIKN